MSKKLSGPLHVALEQAIVQAGGVRALARALDWSVGRVSKIKNGDRMSPYRARQIALYLGLDAPAADRAMYTALAALAKTAAERRHWLDCSEQG